MEKDDQSWLWRPWVLGPVAMVAGAGAAILVLGIPELWTATAAGWAAATGTVLAAGVALYLGRVAIASNMRQQATNTIALAVMLRPLLDNYSGRLVRIGSQTHALETQKQRDHFAGTLAASLDERQKLAKVGEQFANPGVAHLLHEWSGADPSMIREVAQLASLINKMADALRLPLVNAPADGDQLPKIRAHVDTIHELVNELRKRLTWLDRRCEKLESQAQ